MLTRDNIMIAYRKSALSRVKYYYVHCTDIAHATVILTSSENDNNTRCAIINVLNNNKITLENIVRCLYTWCALAVQDKT